LRRLLEPRRICPIRSGKTGASTLEEEES